MKAFVTTNNEETGFPEFFYWDAIEHRSTRRRTPMDWLCYVDGNLIAYLAIYYFSDSVLEINISLEKGMQQHSNEIFAQLYNELFETFGKYRLFGSVFKINFENKMIINSLRDLGATLTAYSRYMQRDIATVIVFEKTALSIKKADINDVAESSAHSFSNPNREAYLFYLNADPVGEIHVLHQDAQILIEEICILPHMENMGYELNMLQELCNIINDKKSLLIEIDADFDTQTKLYKDLGFYDVAFIHNYDKDLKALLKH